jgi:TonB family protein
MSTKTNGLDSEYLSEKHFMATIVAALLLHMSGVYAWYLMPPTPMLDIPVRALNIKLGDGDETPPEEPQIAANQSNIESIISKMVQPQEVISPANIKPGSAELNNNVAKLLDKSMAANDSNVTAREPSKKFIRQNALQANSKGGSVVGNSTAKEAEMMSRYEQLISLWIEKFKQYPDEARAGGMQGDTIIRIRIDRQGNILYYILEHSTNYPLLDRAAIDMVKRANPVPAVPTDYPKGELVEFLIPVNFRLQ